MVFFNDFFTPSVNDWRLIKNLKLSWKHLLFNGRKWKKKASSFMIYFFSTYSHYLCFAGRHVYKELNCLMWCVTSCFYDDDHQDIFVAFTFIVCSFFLHPNMFPLLFCCSWTRAESLWGHKIIIRRWRCSGRRKGSRASHLDDSWQEKGFGGTSGNYFKKLFKVVSMLFIVTQWP